MAQTRHEVATGARVERRYDRRGEEVTGTYAGVQKGQ